MDGDRALYRLDYRGTDPCGGGEIAAILYVANRFAGGRFLTADLFDEEAPALAFYDAGGR